MSRELPLTMELLTAEERRSLLWLARQGIYAALRGEQTPTLSDPTARLTAPTAAFVSLHREGRLRGCIGTLLADQPLHQTVVHMAVSAAFDDPRFTPLSLPEMRALAIEVSRLSALVPARPEQVCPGHHGVCVRAGDHRGVFLPQVASHFHWDRETLLSEVCVKAMLAPDAWRHPHTHLMIFEAEVFGEAESQQPKA
jgi:AmmeMemoRadiSam system protein A